MTIGVINYIFLGFQFPVDGYYMHSFEIWLATTIVFFGSGNVGFSLLEYRLGRKNLLWAFAENMLWVPFLYVVFTNSSSSTSRSHFFLVQLLLLRRSLHPGLAGDPVPPLLVQHDVGRDD